MLPGSLLFANPHRHFKLLVVFSKVTLFTQKMYKTSLIDCVKQFGITFVKNTKSIFLEAKINISVMQGDKAYYTTDHVLG